MFIQLYLYLTACTLLCSLLCFFKPSWLSDHRQGYEPTATLGSTSAFCDRLVRLTALSLLTLIETVEQDMSIAIAW